MFLMRSGREAIDKIRTNPTYIHFTLGICFLKLHWDSVFKEQGDTTLDFFIIEKNKQKNKKTAASKGSNSGGSLSFREVLFMIPTAGLRGIDDTRKCLFYWHHHRDIAAVVASL